jgi:hypothetical protein
MQSTNPDITISRTRRTTTYENTPLEIVLAVVYRRHSQWRACCYFGPGDDDYDEETSSRRATAEQIALRHALDITDAL